MVKKMVETENVLVPKVPGMLDNRNCEVQNEFVLHERYLPAPKKVVKRVSFQLT